MTYDRDLFRARRMLLVIAMLLAGIAFAMAAHRDWLGAISTALFLAASLIMRSLVRRAQELRHNLRIIESVAFNLRGKQSDGT